jgi:phospholipase/carboxylesterase
MPLPLEIITVDPKVKPKASIIFMHGLGADAYDVADIATQLALPSDLAVRFVFPNAPMRPVTYAGGATMRAWFDIGLEINDVGDELGIRNAVSAIDLLISQELDRGIAPNRIVLAGFSQGGIIALQCGLRYPQTLGGMLVLSGALVLEETLSQEKHQANVNTPILMQHGEYDSVINLAWAKQSFAALKCMELNVELQTYKMDHVVCEEEIRVTSKWLQQILI